MNQQQQPYVLNLNGKFQQLVVENSREKINQLSVLVEKLLPDFNKKREDLDEARRFMASVEKDFNEIKGQMDSLKGQIADQNQVISVMKGFRDVETEKILKGVMERPAKSSPKRLVWMPIIIDILDAEGAFMTFDAIWHKLSTNGDVVRGVAEFSGKKLSSLKSAVYANLVYHHNNTKPKNKKICIYNEKFGLVDWTAEDGTINPVYLKEFMFN